VFEILQPLLFSKRRKIGHNVSFDLLSVAKYYGNQIPPPPYGDTWVLYFLLNENLGTGNYKLGSLTQRYLGYTYDEKLGEQAYSAPFWKAVRYSTIDAKMAWMLWWKLSAKLAKPTMLRLRQLFDLTPTEAKVALSIAAGNDVPESAREFRISANTVHTHMRHIFRKLGVRRQAEVVRVLMRAGIVIPATDQRGETEKSNHLPQQKNE